MNVRHPIGVLHSFSVNFFFLFSFLFSCDDIKKGMKIHITTFLYADIPTAIATVN